MANFGTLNFAVALNPTTAFPLDARSYFDDLADAQAAALTADVAGGSNSVYYVGQSLVVVDDTASTLYVIQPDKTLAKPSDAAITNLVGDF